MQEFFDQIQDPNVMNEITSRAGVSEEDIRKVAALGIPTLIAAMNRNAQDDEGAERLSRALDDHANDNVHEPVGFLDRFLGGGGEGERMVDHIFTGNSSQVESSMAARTGMQPDTIKRILSVLAPLILAHMASKWSKNQKAQRQQQQQPLPRQPQQPQSGDPFGRQAQSQGRADSPIQMPDLRTGPRNPQDVRDFTQQTQRQVEDRTGGSIFDMAKDILGGGAGGGQHEGGLLDDLLGGLFGKR